ncbi:MAG: hypothetical protein NZ580_04935 [Bacteroidia bacterium]|nr:hypothetical protein [Bacteroidia bacterium]MDW8236114.1 hypothetical protein [Bacteroidia bacterium]
MPRKWYFLLKEPLTLPPQEQVAQALQKALENWRAHGQPIAWKVDFPFPLLLEITAFSPTTGCSIDKLFRCVKETLSHFQLTLLPSDYVLVLEEGKTFTKKFYDIVKEYRSRKGGGSWQVVELGEGGYRVVPLEESYLRVHL